MKTTFFRAIPPRVLVACIVFVGGCGWAILSIMQGASPPVITTSLSSAQKSVSLIAATPPERPHLEGGEHQAALIRATESLKTSLVAAQLQGHSATDTQAISQEAAEALLLAIDPAADRYGDYLAARGAPESPFIKMAPKEREEFLRTTTQCFAGQQPDLSKVEVRWRYIDGREMEKPKDRGQNATPKRSIDALNNPESFGLTVMEVIVPVPAKTLTQGTKPCRLGFWIGKTRANPKWSTMKVYTYDIPGNVPILLPPI